MLCPVINFHKNLDNTGENYYEQIILKIQINIFNCVYSCT